MNRDVIQHYRTNSENTKPLPENIEYGELSINYRGGGETLFIKNDNNKIAEFKAFDYIENYIQSCITQSNTQVIVKETTSDENGMVLIEDVSGYTYFNATAFDRGQPLNVIRFGNNIYVGYYGGQEEPSSGSAITLLFTAKPHMLVYVYYVRFM
jgi:hypothetical protein